MSTSKNEDDWIKIDLHIHTLDDPKDVLDYSAHQLLERAKELGFGVLAITLHDAVFDRAEVFADAEQMGILLIPAAEVRLQGADIILLNVTANEVAALKNFDDVRQLRDRRGLSATADPSGGGSIFTFAPHPFFKLGGSIGERLLSEIDCFDAIELCHFHKGLFDLNRRAVKVAAQFNKPLLATSDAHQLHAFGRHYTSIPRPSELTIENVFAALRNGPRQVVSPSASILDLASMIYFFFFTHPVRISRQRLRASALESGSQT
jgi:predicted metal-dependent phosphoesterase TrpH